MWQQKLSTGNVTAICATQENAIVCHALGQVGILTVAPRWDLDLNYPWKMGIWLTPGWPPGWRGRALLLLLRTLLSVSSQILQLLPLSLEGTHQISASLVENRYKAAAAPFRSCGACLISLHRFSFSSFNHLCNSSRAFCKIGSTLSLGKQNGQTYYLKLYDINLKILCIWHTAWSIYTIVNVHLRTRKE